MTGRRPPAALLAFALLAAAFACARAPQKKTEVVFWQFWPAEVIQPLLRGFEAENPGITVRMERLAWEGRRDTLLAAVASGHVPDLCALGSEDLPRFLDSGALADWSAGVAGLKDSIRGWEMCSVGETLYGVPWVLDTGALFFNKNLFVRARLDSARPPETWDDLYRAAAAIQRLGGGVHGYGIGGPDRGALLAKFMPYAFGNGGEILSARLDSSRFDSAENREALAFYLRLRRVGTTGSEEALNREFREGRLGLEISGAGMLSRIPAPGLHYGVALVPAPARDRGTHASLADGEVLVSFGASKRKEAALRLARFLVRPDNALALAGSTPGVQPATVGADTLPFYRGRTGPQLMIRQLETARYAPHHPEWEAMEAAIEEAIGKAIADRSTVPESSAARATAEADRAITALLRRR